MLAVALPSVSAELGGTAVDAFWAATSFLLAAAVFQPLWSAQKEASFAATTFLLALALFTLGAASALMARSFVLMIVARCIQGTGAGGLIALTYVIIADFPAAERTRWFGVVALQWAVGTAAGPIIGGTIAQTSDWRWIFWINLPICLLVIVCLPVVLPIATIRKPVAWKRARLTLSNLDWLGAVGFTVSLTALLIALTWGGTLYRWTSAGTLGPLVLGAAGLAAFAVYNACVSRNPFLQKALFATLSTNTVWLAAVVHGILLYCLLFYFPLYFAARGYGPIRVGLALLPYTLTTGIAAVITGICLPRIRMYRVYMWAGWGVTTLGMGLMLLLRADSHGAAWVMVSIVGGAGLGASWSATLTAAQAASDENEGQSSASMFGFLRAIGQAAGVALGGGLFQNALKSKIAQHPDHAMYAGVWAKDAAALIRATHQLASPSDQDLRLMLVTAFVDALRIVFLCLCILSAVVTLALFIWLRDITPTSGLRVEKLVVDGKETTMRTVAYRTS